MWENQDRQSLSDAISTRLVDKLPRRARKWCGLTPAEAALTDEETDMLCRVADSYTRRLASCGLLTPARRRRQLTATAAAKVFVAATVALAMWAGAWRLLDFDSDGHVSIADAHAVLDLVVFGRTDRLPQTIIDARGRTRRMLLSHLPRADVSLRFQDDPAAAFIPWEPTLARGE